MTDTQLNGAHVSGVATGPANQHTPPQADADGLCDCPTIDPADCGPGGQCRRCLRLHPDGVSPSVVWDRATWEQRRTVTT